MIGVTIDGDAVLLLVERRDSLLSCGQAEELAVQLRLKAQSARLNPPRLFRGQPWGAQVQSFDGYVALRFNPPEPGPVKRVPLPAAIAEKLADQLDFTRQQAAFKMRFEFAR